MKYKAIDGQIFYFVKDVGVAEESGRIVFEELHPDTEPDVIIAQHQREVLEAYRDKRLQTVKEISEYLILPLWNVRRALDAAGIILLEGEDDGVGKEETYEKHGYVFLNSVRLLRQTDKAMRLSEIALKIGSARAAVGRTLSRYPDIFMLARSRMYLGNELRYWELTEKGKEIKIPSAEVGAGRNRSGWYEKGIGGRG